LVGRGATTHPAIDASVIYAKANSVNKIGDRTNDLVESPQIALQFQPISHSFNALLGCVLAQEVGFPASL